MNQIAAGARAAARLKLTRREALGALAAPLAGALAGCAGDERPNVLLAVYDDISWLHFGAYGERQAATPAFDRVAREGVLFTHAYSAAPGCTPSRSAILTGQQIYRLGEGGVLMGSLPKRLELFTNRLEDAGYLCAHTGKTWGPGDYTADGRERHPVGKGFSTRRLESHPKGINPTDYAGSFGDFLSALPADSPFFFWYGATEAHRPYAEGAGLAAGKKPEEVEVPSFLPDTPEIRSDLLDYFVEIEHADRHLGRMLDLLEQEGELENTIVIVTADNGMPFPRAKTTLYDWGTRMPLAIRWGARVAGGRVVDDFVSLTDLAPTILEAAGLKPLASPTGRSLMPILTSTRSGRVEKDRDRVVTAHERHTLCRPDNAGYPSRALRTHRYLYVRNYEPDRWPAGDPDIVSDPQGVFGDVDACPTKTFMLEPANRGRYARQFELSFGRRPAEELYDAEADPGMIHNLAGKPAHQETLAGLRQALEAYLASTGDPRSRGEAPWDGYPYLRRPAPR